MSLLTQRPPVKKGDQSAHVPVVHIWRFRGDEEVCRLQILTDTHQAAQLLGKTQDAPAGLGRRAALRTPGLLLGSAPE